jgi:hypothetical protein
LSDSNLDQSWFGFGFDLFCTGWRRDMMQGRRINSGPGKREGFSRKSIHPVRTPSGTRETNRNHLARTREGEKKELIWTSCHISFHLLRRPSITATHHRCLFLTYFNFFDSVTLARICSSAGLVRMASSSLQTLIICSQPQGAGSILSFLWQSETRETLPITMTSFSSMLFNGVAQQSPVWCHSLAITYQTRSNRDSFPPWKRFSLEGVSVWNSIMPQAGPRDRTSLLLGILWPVIRHLIKMTTRRFQTPLIHYLHTHTYRHHCEVRRCCQGM